MKRRMLAVLLTLCMVLSMMPAVTFAAEADFTDIDGHWAESIIEKWADRGVVSGVGNNKFAPDKTLSRAELAQVMYNLLKLTASESDPTFDDVAEGVWYNAAVGACAEEGIVSGIGNNKYGPTLEATREQCMVMLCNVFGIEPLEDTSALDRFADKDSVSGWAKGFVAALVEKELVSGTSTGIAGNTAINRASVLALLNNMISVYVTEAGEYDLKDEEMKGIVLVVCDGAEIVNAAVGTIVTTGPNADNTTVNGDAVSADKTIVVEEKATTGGGGGGSSSGGSSSGDSDDEEEHTCVFGDWISNGDGTHTRECECEETETADCEYSWDKCVKCEYADGKFHVSTVEELTSFAAIVNGGDDMAGEIIVLDGDIDLNNEAWTPIAAGSNVFRGTFDGNGKTISNLNVTQGESDDAVGLFGCVVGTIKNLTIKGGTVSGYHYVGAVAGYVYGTITGCTVDGLTITAVPNAVSGGYDNGDKVGGVVGYLAAEPSATLTENTVKNTSVAGYRDVGGVAGMVNTGDNCSASITGNTVDTVTVTVDQTKEENYGYKTPNAGAIVGRVDAGDDVTISENTEKAVTINVTVEDTAEGPVVADVNGTPYTDIDDAFDNLSEGCTVTILAGTHYLNDSDEWVPRNVTFEIPDNVTIIGMDGAIIEREPKLVASGLTVKNVTFAGSGYVAMQIEAKGDVTFEDCSMTGPNGIYESYVHENATITFKNCDISGDVYGANVGAGNGGNVIIEGGTLSGWNSFGCAVTITDVEFTENENYEYLIFWNDALVENCTFAEGYLCGITNRSYAADHTIEFKNCKMADGSSVIPSLDTEDMLQVCYVIVDGVYIVNNSTMLQKTIENSDAAITIQLLDGDYSAEQISIGSGKDITILGNADDAAKVVFTGQLKVTGALNLKDMTIKTPTAALDTVSQYSKSAIALMNTGDVVCDGVIFEMKDGIADATAITAWWSTGDGANIEVKDCVFNCAGQRPIRSDACVTVEDCTFNDPYRYAVQMTSKSSTMDEEAEAYVIFKNNTINAGTTSSKPVYGVQLEGGYGCSDLTIKGEGNTINLGETGKNGIMYFCECGKVDHNSVVWDTEVAPKHDAEITDGFFEIEAGKTYEISNKAGLKYFADSVNSGTGYSGATVKLTANIDLESEAWTPIGQTGGYYASTYFQGTFDGQGHTISNLVIPKHETYGEGGNYATGLFGFIDAAAATIKNVNVDGAMVTGGHWTAVIVGYMTGEISGCSVTNAEVVCAHYNDAACGDKAGVIAGYLNGAVTVSGCKVSNSSVTAGRDAGGIVGAANLSTATVTNNTVEKIKIAIDKETTGCTDGRLNGGAIVGSVLGGTVAESNTATDVELTSTLKQYAEMNNALYTSLDSALDAVPDNEPVTIVVTGEETCVLESASNKDITIVGTKETVIDITLGCYMDSGKIAFEGVTIKGSTGKANGNGSDYAALYSPNVTYTDCTFDGPFRVGRDGATFIGCTFTNLGNDYIWNYGNKVTFEDCVFNTDGKALLLYSDGNGTVPEVIVKNCTFNATAGAKAGAIANQNCAAIEIDNFGSGVDLTVEGNTFDDNFSGEWRIKSYYSGREAVSVNDVEYTSIAIDGKTMTIDADRNVTVNE